jgi:outer membrane receptor protein involved in Fe transport
MRKFGYLLCALFSAQFCDAQEKDSAAVLQEVVVRGKKPLVQVLPDKMIINVESALTNTGATILEVLEKSPGVAIDRNGNISLKGKQGVLVMVDGKPAQLTGNDLNNFLSGISASQVEVIELIDNPSAKYDAAGSAGIVNIRTKKNKQKGFNGNLTLSAGQGKFFRTANNFNLNYYTGKVNLFANLSANVNRNYTDLYALRSYYNEDNGTVSSLLEQPSYFTGKAPFQTLKAGMDYYLSHNTTLGAVISGTKYHRTTAGNNTAIWMDQAKHTDSVIGTTVNNSDRFKNIAINVNGRHSFSATSELTADLDFIGYRIDNQQHFVNRLTGINGYTENIDGNLPSNIDILTGKADYVENWKSGFKLETGWKSSHVETDNRAAYFLNRSPDYGKTNHFLYKENIHAAYVNVAKKSAKWTLQGGLRYENTSYNAAQLGNVERKDSSFSRNYDGLFPSLLVSVQSDSNNNFSFSAARRIDRPVFQSLNPFVFVINKYTYESGNPFFVPQYTWNTEFTHSYKNILVTSLSYSITKDYFSQIFLQDSTGIITYTSGNLDKMENAGLSVSVQLSPASWWSLSAQANVNYKFIKGFVWDERKASLVQGGMNMNNQFNFSKGWSGEVSGYYTLKEQELQEITDPTGELALGIAKKLFKEKGTVRLSVRDVFHSWWMKGFTTFEKSTEYFKITRDTRVVTFAFTYRFGGQVRNTRRNTGGAEEEMNRVRT